MRTSLRTSTLVLAILGSISFAAAQSTPGDMQQEKLNLSQSKERQVTQGLSREQSQSAAGYQGQVGSKPPASLSAKPMPDDVADQVPETKRYLFIKLPDRIVLIDPDTNMVAEIVGAPATTGANPGDAAAPRACDVARYAIRQVFEVSHAVEAHVRSRTEISRRDRRVLPALAPPAPSDAHPATAAPTARLGEILQTPLWRFLQCDLVP